MDKFILFEILSRVPIESLVRFKCVSKYWQWLIESEEFIRLHLMRSRDQPSLIITTAKEEEINFFSVEGEKAVHWFNTCWSEPMLRSLNGLLCIVESGDDAVRVFNPSTRQITPSIKTTFKMGEEVNDDGTVVHRLRRFGFGCDEGCIDHKVVCVWEIHQTTADYVPMGVHRVCEVLTVGENRWRVIDDVPRYNMQGSSVNNQGHIFWMNAGPLECLAPECNALVAFNVATEKFISIDIHDHIFGTPRSLLSNQYLALLELNGSLAIILRTIDGIVKLLIFDDSFLLYVNKFRFDRTCWSEETITMPFSWDGSLDPTFRLIDERIVMRSISYDSLSTPIHPKGSATLYIYDRKTGMSKKVEVTGIYSLDTYPFDYTINLITKSLLPVSRRLCRVQST